jgi:hypothetical protein
MENQHRKITGYRELDQTEIDLMNEVKALGIQMEAVLKKVDTHVYNQIELSFKEGGVPSVDDRLRNSTPQRFLALAKTEFQTGLMYATRAVAQPEFF